MGLGGCVTLDNNVIARAPRVELSFIEGNMVLVSAVI